MIITNDKYASIVNLDFQYVLDYVNTGVYFRTRNIAFDKGSEKC